MCIRDSPQADLVKPDTPVPASDLRVDINERVPRPLATVDVDEFADMYSLDRPYRVILWEPEHRLVDKDVPHAGRNFSRGELRALAEAALSLLNQPLPEHLEPDDGSEWEYEPNREALAMEARVEPEGRWGDE